MLVQRYGPVLRLIPRKFEDERGWFMETWSARGLAALGVMDRFVQDNHSMSVQVGTVRGIHFQNPPHAQAKLVRCVRGAVMDYTIDLRRASPTYGRWVSAKLTAQGAEQLYIPIGFGHAFVTLEPSAEVAYKVSDIYAPDCEAGIRWDDPIIAIDWPLPSGGAMLSGKDQGLPALSGFDSPFEYDGRSLVLRSEA